MALAFPKGGRDEGRGQEIKCISLFWEDFLKQEKKKAKKSVTPGRQDSIKARP